MLLVMPGGRRMIDQVLDPEFIAGLQDVPIDVLRRRRHEAMQEESDLSYVRRMLQGRIEILQARRGTEAHSDDELVALLTTALSDNISGGGGSGPQHAAPEPSRMGERRRFAERLVADVTLSSPESAGDSRIEEVIGRLGDQERAVSDVRRQVHGVIDVISGELASRYGRISAGE